MSRQPVGGNVGVGGKPPEPKGQSVRAGGAEFVRKLRWLMLSRSLFAMLTLGATLVYRAGEHLSFFVEPLTSLYVVAGFVFLVNLLYLGAFRWFKHEEAFGGVQVFGDVLVVSAIAYLTGLLYSPFLFLYPIVIICGTIILGRVGGYLTAGIACIAFGALVDFQYYGFITPPGFEFSPFAEELTGQVVFYRTSVLFLACLVTCLVSGYIAEQEVRARADLAVMEEQVKRVEKMAVIGEMAAGLAHEIKNPLASLSGSIQMLKGETGWEPHHEKLMGIAVRETARLSGLVTEFLLFARPGAGSPVPILVSSVVEETVALLEQDSRHGHHVGVEVLVVEGLTVCMDLGHLRQVLLNLLINATEAVSDGGSVIVSGYRENRKRVVLSVKDDGAGIDAEIAKHIFDPFFTTKKEGTGLGLSIVHRLLDECGGGIRVMSRPGEGAEFTLSLPSGSGSLPSRQLPDRC
ncbi:two-component system sensor histidine kinase NtrB [Desulfoluna spongiiphila]|uniref:two-component system sensor histidine kinase NtrB n=1 Tax=Desulfoluna spongiiphila TaxID=419481 RepID=UPI001253AA12|nr:ATP-binding protein [Desulfoluna spongiiphila]VVS91203.1 consensus disorder prediction [Desulfoluna spongiiphila]